MIKFTKKEVIQNQAGRKMKLFASIVITFFFIPVFGQNVRMIPNKQSALKEFYQDSEGVFCGSKEHIVSAYPIPGIFNDNLKDSLVMYKIGKDLGVNNEATYTVGCYELSFENKTDSLVIVDSMYLLPFYYLNISDRLRGHNSETVIKVFTSEKKRKRWLRNKEALFRSEKTDESEMSVFNYYIAKDDIWEKNYIYLPLSYNFNKPVYVYIVIQDPTDRILVRFK